MDFPTPNSTLVKIMRGVGWMVLGLTLLTAIVYVGVVKPWIHGDWKSPSPTTEMILRHYFQCWGTRTEESLRWAPERVLISACDSPYIKAISPSQTRAIIWRPGTDPNRNDVEAQYLAYTTTLTIPDGRVLRDLPVHERAPLVFLTDDLVLERLGYREHAPRPFNGRFVVHDLASGVDTYGYYAWSSGTDLMPISFAEVHFAAASKVYFVDSSESFLVFVEPDGLVLLETLTYEMRDLARQRSVVTIYMDEQRPTDSRLHGGGYSCPLRSPYTDRPGNWSWAPMFVSSRPCDFQVYNPILMRP